jgi:tetratricopeptide (TPR) repeat protein
MLRDSLQAEISLPTRVRRRLAAHRAALLSALAVVLIGGAGWAAWLSSQPPASIQHFNNSWQLRQAGDLSGAESELRRAVAADPSFRRARFELARVLLQQGQVDAALGDFFLLTKSGNDACSEAYVGYCQSRKHQPLLAIAWYERALDSGCDAGEVYNNLAAEIALADRSHDPETKLAMAEAHLKQALARLPDSPTVKLNWLMHEFRAVESQEYPVSDRAIDIAHQLTAQFPSDGFVHELAAQLMALASASEPDRLFQAISWLRRACELGHGPSLSMLEKDRHWDPVRTSPEFAALLAEARAVPPGKRRELSISRVLEPLSCAPEQPASVGSD